MKRWAVVFGLLGACGAEPGAGVTVIGGAGVVGVGDGDAEGDLGGIEHWPDVRADEDADADDGFYSGETERDSSQYGDSADASILDMDASADANPGPAAAATFCADCVANLDCPSGMLCHDGVCTVACDMTTPCIEGMFCVGGYCAPPKAHGCAGWLSCAFGCPAGMHCEVGFCSN